MLVALVQEAVRLALPWGRQLLSDVEWVLQFPEVSEFPRAPEGRTAPLVLGIRAHHSSKWVAAAAAGIVGHECRAAIGGGSCPHMALR